MSRQRALKDPFWAVSINNMQAGVRGIVRELYEVFKRSGLLDVIHLGSGWRTGSIEHRSGTALDVMVASNVNVRPTPAERAKGLLVINWLIKNEKTLGIEGIIFSRDGRDRPEVWGYSGGKKWRVLKNRGSVSGNHIDHFHIKFKSGASWDSSLNGSVIGGSPVKVTKPTPTKEQKPIDVMAKEVIDGKHGNGHSNRQKSLNVSTSVYAQVRAKVNELTKTKATDMPQPVKVPDFPKGLGPNKSRPSAVALQRQLKAAGFMPRGVKENANYGPQTQRAVAAFHNKHTQFRSRGKIYDPAIGPKGWKFLFERW